MSNLIRATAFMRSSDWTLLKLDCFEKGRAVIHHLDVETIWGRSWNFDPSNLIEQPKTGWESDTDNR